MTKKPTKRTSRKTVAAQKYSKPMLHSPNVIQTKARGPIRRTAATMGTGAVAGSGGGSGQSVAQSPLYYDYRWSTPDKFYFPKNRVVANSIWREVYKRDAAVSISTDMYAEMPWSSFDLGGIDDPGIRHIYEDMFSKIDPIPKLPQFTKDFLITGELVLHHTFDSTLGIWDRVIPHNPDYVRVEGVGLAVEQPLLWLLPTPEIRRMVNSTDPRVRQLQKLLPKDVVNAFRMNREIPLDPLNTVYIPRLISSTDIRGTSLYTRLFRVIMYEDFIVNASLAVAQRNAAPLRIFKLGDPNSGWLPSEEDEAAFAEMLSMAESDPLAAIIMHHNVTAELVGVSDRVLLISREWDFIERVKLLAMGISKSFLLGEASFASAIAGLQTLMQRLASLRARFERTWFIKHLCEPIAKIHEFYKTPSSNLENRIRVRKPLDELELIIPSIKWSKSLEATQDVAILNIWRDMKERGILSERTYAAGAGIDINNERKNLKEERTYKQEHPDIYGIPGAAPPGQPGQKAPQAPKPPLAGPGLAPPPSSTTRDRATRNAPFSRLGEYKRDVEDRLVELSNNDGQLDIDTVLDVLEDVEVEKAASETVESLGLVGDTGLLSGS